MLLIDNFMALHTSSALVIQLVELCAENGEVSGSFRAKCKKKIVLLIINFACDKKSRYSINNNI